MLQKSDFFRDIKINCGITSKTQKYCKSFVTNFIVISALLFSSALKAQQKGDGSMDAELTAQLTISGFCLCKTTVAELQGSTGDLKRVEVEEMDVPKNCYGQMMHYTSGEGYASKKIQGMIFQKGDQGDYIGKIRITSEFKGKLPDGTPIDMSTLKLRDVFEIYPELKDKWGSRGCSGYWHFVKGPLYFFVKINKDLQPQFPINEAYYLDKPVEAIDLVYSCYGIYHAPEPNLLFNESDPLFFVDSIRVNRGVLAWYKPEEIAVITVLKDSTAIRIAGPAGKNGIVYVYRKEYARNKSWKYFKSKSAKYAQAVPTLEKEKDLVYIINGKVLEKNIESTLFSIVTEGFIELRMIDEVELKKEFNIKKKKLGVFLKTTSEE